MMRGCSGQVPEYLAFGARPAVFRIRVAQAKWLNCYSGWPSREMAQRGEV